MGIAGYCAPKVKKRLWESAAVHALLDHCMWAFYFWWVVVDIAGLGFKVSAPGVAQLDFSAICKVLLCCIAV